VLTDRPTTSRTVLINMALIRLIIVLQIFTTLWNQSISFVTVLSSRSFLKPNIYNSCPCSKKEVNDNSAASRSFDEDEFVSEQKKLSTKTTPDSFFLKMTRTDHIEHQRKVFDEISVFFANEENIVPADVRPAVTHICKRFLSDIVDMGKTDIRILDVGCGTGVLFKYLLESSSDFGIHLNITGIDLSSKMIQQAKERKLEHENLVSLQLFESDFNEWSSSTNEKYDGVIMNAVFGNFYDLDEVISSASKVLEIDGILAISHPLGFEFQRKLHDEDSNTVRHCLPTLPQYSSLIKFQPLTFKDFTQKVYMLDENKEIRFFPMYYLSSRRVPFQLLKNIMRFRGPVSLGYKRGSKQLGVPTANLPEILFSAPLQNIPTGVYFGWAVIEQNSSTSSSLPGRNTCHKAVVNIGFSPTFVGKENPHKIIEAHLIDANNISDFYDENIRLQLIGFLRNEQKFSSLDALKTQIYLDIDRAREALNIQPFAALRTDCFLVDPCKQVKNTDITWVGQGGGNINASWEFEGYDEAVKR